MIFEVGFASKFANICGIEEMKYSAIAWWYPSAAEFGKARRKGLLL
jgi:hypothetical protein